MSIHESRLSKWFHQGVGNLNVDQLRYFAAVLGCPVEDLVYYPGHEGPGPVGNSPEQRVEQDIFDEVVDAVGGPRAAASVLLKALREGEAPPPEPRRGVDARPEPEPGPKPAAEPPRRRRGRPPKPRP